MPTLNWIGKDAGVNHHKEVSFCITNGMGVRFGAKIGQWAESSLLLETLEFRKYAIAQIGNGEER